jgi:hypothetical protein
VLIKRLDPPEAMRPRRCRITIGGERSKTSTSSRTGTSTMVSAPSQAGGRSSRNRRAAGVRALSVRRPGGGVFALTCRQGWPVGGSRVVVVAGGRCGGGRGRCRGVEAAVTACGDAELDDARGARDHDQEHAEDGGEQEGDTERQVAVCAEVAGGHALAVLQDEDQQQEQDDGKQRGGDPGSADACPPDDVVDGAGCAGAWFAGAAVPGAVGWVPPAGCVPPIKLYRIYFPRLPRLNGAPGWPMC